MSILFDDLDQGGPVDSQKPFFMLDPNNESDVLTWLNDTLGRMQQNSWMRLEKARNNYLRYKNIQYQGQVYQPRDVMQTQKRYMPQVVMPLIRDAVDEKVARMMESKPNVTVIPKDGEERDKVDAKVAKRFLSHMDYQEKVPAKIRQWLKNAEVGGESFIVCRWNPDKGPALPEAKMLGLHAMKIGDAEVKVFDVFHYFYEEHPSKDYEQVNYAFTIEYEYTEGLRKDYAEAAGNIQPEPIGTTYFDFESMEETPLAGFTKKITFHHRATKYVPQGYEAVFVKGKILKKGPLPEEYEGELPGKRLIVSQNEGELHGESPIESVRGIAAQVNNAQNLIIKQLMLCAHPKWFVQQGAVDDIQLNNDTGIVKIKNGANAPVLAQANPVSPQLMAHVQELKKDFYDYAKSNSVVRGEPPEGVSAFVALQYVSESESRRLSTEVQRLSEGVVEIYQSILKVCGVKYQPGEPRTMMIQGKDNRYNMMKYDPATLKGNFAVVMQNTSGLPDARSARMQALLETEERFPGMIPREQVVEMLGFAQVDKFYDQAGAAVRAAEEENDMILDGQGMIEPEEHEDLIQHWKIHIAAIQDVAFKTKVDPMVQQAMKGHIMATEMMMIEKAQTDGVFAQAVEANCPQFPRLFQPPPPPPPMGPPPGGDPGAPGPVPGGAPPDLGSGQLMPSGPNMDGTMASGALPPQPPMPAPPPQPANA